MNCCVETSAAPATVTLDLSEVAFALSDALDLVGVNILQHGKRVAYMARECGRALELPEPEADDLFLAALLHDSGVSSSRVHRSLLGTFDWEGADEHCVAGHRLLSGFAPFRRIAEVVRWHHTHTADPALARVDADVARFANLIFLSDRVDALAHQNGERDVLLARGDIRREIARRSGEHFTPHLVEAFLETSESEAFWLMTEPHHLERYMQEASREALPRKAGPGSLRELAAVFARIVDAKNPFTAEHSLGVARLARLLGELSGLSPSEYDRLEIAGLLHDLGKLRVPDEVLDKPGALDEAEFATMERHTFETYQILRRIRAFGPIASWAAFHHETPSGRGYPFRVADGGIPLEARLVAVADVFQALSQERPYRSALTPVEILVHLHRMVLARKLDGDVVDLVAKNFEACWNAAVGTRKSAWQA